MIYIANISSTAGTDMAEGSVNGTNTANDANINIMRMLTANRASVPTLSLFTRSLRVASIRGAISSNHAQSAGDGCFIMPLTTDEASSAACNWQRGRAMLQNITLTTVKGITISILIAPITSIKKTLITLYSYTRTNE